MLPEDINVLKLERQLSSLSDLNIGTVENITHLSKVFSNFSPTTRLLFSEVEELLKLVMTIPISVAESERTFSCLRRLKTWLRTKSSQKRLTHAALLHYHQKSLDEIDVAAVMKEFILKTAERRAVFGSI